MQEARLPDDEAGRLATLHGMGILDTPREVRFDRYTRIAARTFGMPIALISLVDRNRQWFKSAEGLDGDETPREFSFCGHAILGDGVFEVRNTRLDPRFRDNPLVTGPPRIRFYAGAPLKAPNGHRIGTLCIIDRLPRQLSHDEKSRLQDLAEMVAGELIKDADAKAIGPDHVTHTISGERFFNAIPNERGLSVLLFDIDDVLASHDDDNASVSPGEIFAQLLHEHFPTALSIAHIGDYHFCVLLGPDEAFDEVRAINHVCSDAKKMLCFAAGHVTLAPFVGRIQYNSDRYASVDEMFLDADRMFLRHEPIRDEPDLHPFVRMLIGWRETIF